MREQAEEMGIWQYLLATFLFEIPVPVERTKYERTEAAITREKDKLRKAQEFFAIHNERFGHEFASSAFDKNTNLVLHQSPLIGHSSTFISRGYQKII